MPIEKSNDFLDFVSLPSSLKLKNDDGRDVYYPSGFKYTIRIPPYPPFTKIKTEVKIKTEGVKGASDLEWHLRDEAGEIVQIYTVPKITATVDWTPLIKELTFSPATARYLDIFPRIGAGDVGTPAITKFDDLKIYQNDELIHENYFTALRPGKIVPTVIRPPEIIIGAIQRFKAGRVGGEILRTPLAPVL